MDQFCKICSGLSYNKPFCSPCFKTFIKKIPTQNEPGYAIGGGSLSDSISKQLGTDAEKLFSTTCNSLSKPFRFATPFENKKRHFDYIVKDNSKYLKIEVKSMKARHRGEDPDPSIVYVEIYNIDGGPGWVYGDADYIAFQLPDKFLCVSRVELVWKVNSMVSKLPFVTKSGIEYTLYGRSNRKDMVVVLPIHEIMSIRDAFAYSL
jgi:hypothetical protein